MKKWYCLIIGLMVIAATVEAGCGSCGADAKKAKEKAACSLEKAEGEAACALKKTECVADCKKPCCAAKDKCDKAKDKCDSACKGEKKGILKKLMFWK